MNVNLHAFPWAFIYSPIILQVRKKKSSSSQSVVTRDPSQAEGALSAWQSQHHEVHDWKKLHSYCTVFDCVGFFFLVHFLGLSLEGIHGRQYVQLLVKSNNEYKAIRRAKPT